MVVKLCSQALPALLTTPMVLLCCAGMSACAHLQVLPPQAWDVLFREVERRLAARPGAVQHLIVLLPVPIVYPKIPVSETVLGAISSESSCW